MSGAGGSRRGLPWQAAALAPGVADAVAAVRAGLPPPERGWLVGVAWGTPGGGVLLQDVYPVAGGSRCCYLEAAAAAEVPQAVRRRVGAALHSHGIVEACDAGADADADALLPAVVGNLIALCGPELRWCTELSPLPPLLPPPANNPSRIAVLGGLWGADALTLDLVRGFLTGSLGCVDDASAIRRVVVFGDVPESGDPLDEARRLAQLNAWFRCLARSIPVDIVSEEEASLPYDVLSSSAAAQQRRSPHRFLAGPHEHPLHVVAVAHPMHHFPASLATGLLHLAPHGDPLAFANSTFALAPLPHAVLYPAAHFGARRVHEGMHVVAVPPLETGVCVLLDADGSPSTVVIERC